MTCGALVGCAAAERNPSAERVARTDARIVLGPMVGHVTDGTARLWLETDRPGRLSVVLTDASGQTNA